MGFTGGSPIAKYRVLVAALSLAVTAAAAQATEYAIEPLGLTDPAHTLANNTYLSTVSLINSQGDIAGTSLGIAGNNSQADAWLYRAANRSVSLISLPNSTFSSDWDTSVVSLLNSSGDAVGITRNQNLTTMQAAWVYNHATGVTTRIGLTDSDHINPNVGPSFGQQSSNVSLLNVNGQVAGTSLRYSLGNGNDGQGSAGTDTWFYNKTANTTVQIGLTGGIYTGGSNQTSGLTAMNASGVTLGFSYQYTGTTLSNQTSAWLYDPSSNTTSALALPPSVTIPAAYPNTAPIVRLSPAIPWESPINDEGDISITATGPAAGNVTQSLAYLYNPTTGYAQQVGLTSAAYQSANGTFYSQPYFLTATGNIVGVSYLGGSTRGSADIWYFDKSTGTTLPINPASFNGSPSNVPFSIDPSGQHVILASQNSVYCEYNNLTHTSTQLGYTGGIYNNTSGNSFTHFHRLNANGQAAGYSIIFNGGDQTVGTQAWFFDPNTTTSIPIGLFDPVDTDPQGFPRNAPAILNDNGIIVGTSTRYTGKVLAGNDGWYYDPASNTTTPIRMSVESNGFANLTFKSLSPNGIALGSFAKFDGNTYLGQFAFLFDPATGPIDLGLNVANLSDNGWQYLQSATAALATGQIIGMGHLTNEVVAYTLSAYLLTPVLPGDANIDGKVDLGDLSIVLNNFGAATTSWTDGNFDNAATIDLTDLSDVLNNFGLTNPNASVDPAPALGAAAAPEPASLALLLPALLMPRRRRRQPRMRFTR
ncbi:MAG: hypothetical protein ACTHN5_04715 [Phycisphaerae bacterium]